MNKGSTEMNGEGIAMTGVVVHEWISRTGGSEKVLDAIVDAFDGSEVWCLWNDVPELRYPDRLVRESWIAKTPLRHNKALALPAMVPTWRQREARDVDWVLASSHLFAHHVKVASSVPKFSYVYTPARYIWAPELDQRGASWLPRALAPALRRVDRARAQESHQIAAISEFVQHRIQRCWDRDSVVIYPPVDVARIQRVTSWRDRLNDADREIFETLPSSFILGASRFVTYKRLELVIDAGEASDMPVVLAGGGPDEGRLRARAESAKVPVLFVDRPSDDLLYALYEAALVLVFLAIEDFGIIPVEVMAAGTPVVTLDHGGASETVLDGLTGAHVAEPTSARELSSAVARAVAVSRDRCRARAAEFDGAVFREEIRNWIQGSV